MMFYFNHTSGHTDTSQPLEARFEQLMLNYRHLLLFKELCVEKGIISTKQPEEVSVQHSTLRTLIRTMEDKDLRRMVYSWFTRYPADAQQEYNIEQIYQEYEELDYTYHIADEEVTHLLVALRLDWPILSMPMDKVWLSHEVEVECSDSNGKPIKVRSFHGNDDANFSSMARWLIEQKYQGANLEQRAIYDEKRTDILKTILGRHRLRLSPQAEERYKGFSNTEKDFVEDMLRRAYEQQRLFPPKADDDLVKTCRGKGNGLTYEIRHNQGIRIYFQSYCNILIIGGIHTKAEGDGDEQSADINRATTQCEEIISRLDL